MPMVEQHSVVESIVKVWSCIKCERAQSSFIMYGMNLLDNQEPYDVPPPGGEHSRRHATGRHTTRAEVSMPVNEMQWVQGPYNARVRCQEWEGRLSLSATPVNFSTLGRGWCNGRCLIQLRAALGAALALVYRLFCQLSGHLLLKRCHLS